MSMLFTRSTISRYYSWQRVSLFFIMAIIGMSHAYAQFAFPFTKTSEGYGKRIEPTTDGGYVYLSHHEELSDCSSSPCGYPKLGKVDPSGILEFEVQFDPGDYPDYSRVLDVEEVSDGYILVLTLGEKGPAKDDRSEPAYGLGDLWIIKTDRSGNKLWDKVYGGLGQEVDVMIPQPWPDNTYEGQLFGYINYIHADIVSTGDGFLIATGSDSNPMLGGNKYSPLHDKFGDIWVIKIDHDGKKIMDKTYHPTLAPFLNSRANAFSIKPTSDNGFIIAGSVNYYLVTPHSDTEEGSITPTGEDALIIKCDQNGNTQWSHFYNPFGTGSLNNYWARFQDIEFDDDGSFMVGGTIYFLVEDEKGDAIRKAQYWLTKINSYGTVLNEKFFGDGNTYNKLVGIDKFVGKNVNNQPVNHWLLYGESTSLPYNSCSNQGNSLPYAYPMGAKSPHDEIILDEYLIFPTWIICLAGFEQLWDITLSDKLLHYPRKQPDFIYSTYGVEHVDVRKRLKGDGFYFGGIGFTYDPTTTVGSDGLLISGPDKLCLDETATYTFNTDAYQYGSGQLVKIISPGLLLISETSNSVTVKAVTGGTQYLSGYIGQTYIPTRCIEVITTGPPMPTSISGPTGICPMEGANFTINAVDGATSYTWAATTSSGAPAPDVILIPSFNGLSCYVERTPQISGSYFYLKVKANNKCGSSNFQSKTVMKWTWGQPPCIDPQDKNDDDAVEQSDSFTVYPNPSLNSLHMNYQPVGDATVIIQNSMGDVMIKQKFAADIDISSLPKGVFYISIQDQKNKITKRFIKE